MLSFPHFAMPSVHPGHSGHATLAGSDRPTVTSQHGCHPVRVAGGGRVLTREWDDQPLTQDALPEAIDF